MGKKNAGRKALPPGEKKTPVTIYLTRDEISYLGGMNEVKKHLLIKVVEKIENKQKHYVKNVGGEVL